MPEGKISELSPLVSTADTNVLALEQAGSSFSATLAQIDGYTGSPVGLTKLASQSVSTPVVSVDFDSEFAAGYEVFMLDCKRVTVSADGNLLFQFSNGGTELTTGYYGHSAVPLSLSTAYSGSAVSNSTAIQNAYLESGGNNSYSGQLFIHGALDATINTLAELLATSDRITGSNAIQQGHGGFVHNYTTTNIDGITVLHAAGNITGGDFALYGLEK